jgi:putative inorganic carbon (hco3(-)) transporter
MNFGLEGIVPFALYAMGIACLLLTVFWKPLIGIFYLLPLIPLQTLRYRTNDYPLGGSMIGIMLLGVAIGILRQGRPVLPRNKWTVLIIIYGLFTYGSLCLGSSYIGQPFPLPGDARFATWQEYMVMPALLLLVVAAAPTKREMWAMVVVICLSTLLADKSFWNTVSGRDFSSYSEDLHQESGSMGFAGINGLAAFTAQSATFLLAMAAFERRFWVRSSYQALAIFSAICLMYSLSRGGYAAFLVGWIFIGLFKQRKLLVLFAVFAFTWATLVPPAVQQRVQMTYDPVSGELDSSANTRLSLWDNALKVFDSNALLGTGFNTYQYMHLDKRTDGSSGYYEDTHNYFIKVLLETGVLGLVLFLWLLARLFGDGYSLFRNAEDPFFASLGLGLLGWLVCAAVACLFGDRWSFLQVNGYLWVIAGLVVHAASLERSAKEPAVSKDRDGDDSELLDATEGQPSYDDAGQVMV